jgi:hypothetical protein
MPIRLSPVFKNASIHKARMKMLDSVRYDDSRIIYHSVCIIRMNAVCVITSTTASTIYATNTGTANRDNNRKGGITEVKDNGKGKERKENHTCSIARVSE